MNEPIHSPNERCARCWYFQKFHAEPKGNCLRYPPHPLPNGTNVRPKVSVNEYACGEFLPGHRPDFEKSQVATPAQALRDRQRELKGKGIARPIMATTVVNRL